jgi:hypothetical protein
MTVLVVSIRVVLMGVGHWLMMMRTCMGRARLGPLTRFTQATSFCFSLSIWDINHLVYHRGI